MKKSLWITIIVSLILRIILSLSTFHPDMQAFDLAGKLVASGKVLNLYEFNLNSVVLNYPPAIYLFHGLFGYLFKLVGLSELNQPNINFLLLKLPYLIFDLLIGIILYKLVGSNKKAILAFALWMFNPINLYVTYMLGQFDIIPTFFIILAVYFVTKNKLKWAALAIGFGVAFKLSPIFLAVPVAIYNKNFLGRIKLLILAGLPYFISIIPYIFSKSFRATALFTDQNTKSLYAGISVSGAESILLFPAVLLFFYLVIWFFPRKLNINKLFLIPLLLFFILTHYHPQWLIWITPLLILDLITSKFKSILPVCLIIYGWLGSLFFFDPSLTIGIFSPVWPSLQTLSHYWYLAQINSNFNLPRSIFQTIFVSAALYLICQNSLKIIFQRRIFRD